MKTAQSRLSLIFTSIIFVLLSFGFSIASTKPVITSHTAQYSDGALIVTVQWQSENLVTKAILMAGQEQKSMKLENDNRRIPEGYHGEAVISAPVQQSMGTDTIIYSLQLEDEYRIKSELVQGRFSLPKQTIPGMQGSSAAPAWGQSQGQIQLPQNQQTQTGQLPPVPHTGIMQQQLLPQDGTANQQQMMPQQQQMMPQQQQMMPPQQGMEQQQQMMQQQQQMIPPQQGMDPQQQNMMPPQQQEIMAPPPPIQM